MGCVAAFDTARTRAERFFGNPAILLERYVPGARHVEVQLLGLADGIVVALGERDCSVQRRHQKVAEETPSPAVSSSLRATMLAAAIRAGETVGYRGAGTVEFLLDPVHGDFFFLEMNTRLQVEHPVTELVTGIDLVEQHLLIAADERLFDPASVTSSGMRSSCASTRRTFAASCRVPASSRPGESLRGGRTRRRRVRRGQHGHPGVRSAARQAVCLGRRSRGRARPGPVRSRDLHHRGPKNNLPFFVELPADPAFTSGAYDTSLVDRMRS